MKIKFATILFSSQPHQWWVTIMVLIQVEGKVPSSDQRGIFHITTIRFPSYEHFFGIFDHDDAGEDDVDADGAGNDDW